MHSSVYQLFSDHIKLNSILWFLLLLPFLDVLFLWQPSKEKVPKRKISASDGSAKIYADPSKAENYS